MRYLKVFKMPVLKDKCSWSCPSHLKIKIVNINICKTSSDTRNKKMHVAILHVFWLLKEGRAWRSGLQIPCLRRKNSVDSGLITQSTTIYHVFRDILPPTESDSVFCAYGILYVPLFSPFLFCVLCLCSSKRTLMVAIMSYHWQHPEQR